MPSPASALPFAGALSSSTSLRRMFQQTTPGFSTLQGFFSRWLNLDITTLAVALTVFGALSTGAQQLKGIGLDAYRWIVRFFTASVSIPGSDRLNREVLNWIGAKVLMRQQTRILTASSEPVQNEAWDFRRATIRRDYHHEKRLPIQYLPTFGITWFFHDRNLFLIRRIPESARKLGQLSSDSPDQYVIPPAGHEPLVVMCLGRSVKPIKAFLETCRDFADKQRESFITVRASRDRYSVAWDTTILRPIRPLNTVHMGNETKDELVSDIDNYLKPATRRFYTDRGIPYRRGYLLHGPPGTGKTSLSLALAGRFGLELYILHIPTIDQDGSLERLFTSLPPQCIVLLEDIDAVGMKRELDEDEAEETPPKEVRRSSSSRSSSSRRSGVTLSGLLNVLDGVTSQEGRIVLMTSNIADKLDEALVRPGRIDKMIFLGNIYGEAAEEMFLRMYAPDQNEESNPAEPCAKIDPEKLKKLAANFRTGIPDDVFTPAQLQGYLLNHRHQPDVAVENVEEWCEIEKAKMEETREIAAELKRKKAQRRKERAEQKDKMNSLAAGLGGSETGPAHLAAALQFVNGFKPPPPAPRVHFAQTSVKDSEISDEKTPLEDSAKNKTAVPEVEVNNTATNGDVNAGPTASTDSEPFHATEDDDGSNFKTSDDKRIKIEDVDTNTS